MQNVSAVQSTKAPVSTIAITAPGNYFLLNDTREEFPSCIVPD